MKYYIDQKASFSKTISEYDVYSFAGICGDFNSVHVNKEEAKNSIFEGQVAHGMLIASFISTVLGMKLPGEGTIYLKQELNFLAPVKIGDTIEAIVVVTEIIKEKSRLKLTTVVVNQLGIVVVDGFALVQVPNCIDN
jgi:3-hydroxybutyryl-CoA dehydratase